jgi:hypothetical protein
MNIAEKIAATYLRLNGFLLLPHFTVLGEESHNHIDLIGLRPEASAEVANGTKLPRDSNFSRMLRLENPLFEENAQVGIVVECRGNKRTDYIGPAHIAYARPFLGGVDPARILFSSMSYSLGHVKDEGIWVDLHYAYSWIHYRIWASDRLCGKSGSWYLSDDFLSDTIVIQRLARSAPLEPSESGPIPIMMPEAVARVQRVSPNPTRRPAPPSAIRRRLPPATPPQ